MKPTLVILAAGAGTRYGGLKQLAAMGPGGETLLEYSAFDALRAGFGRVVVVVRAETEPSFRQRLDSRMARSASVSYAHQCQSEGEGTARRKPWGTGHAVLAVESAIDGPFAVINADDFYGAEPYAAVARFLEAAQTDRRQAVIGFRLAETLSNSGAVSRALLGIDDDGRLTAISEYPEIWRREDRIVYRDDDGEERTVAGNELVSMNMWGFNPALLPELRRRFASFVSRHGNDPEAEFLLPEVIQTLVAEGLFEVEVLPAGGEWCGLTFRQDEQRVRSMIASLIQQGHYPSKLWS